MILKIARRGASGYLPENTMAAFSKAAEIDCDVVEIDIHKTKDQQIIAMHDHTVIRTTDGLGKIQDLTLKELKEFHEPNDESIPTLQGIFDLLKNRRKMMLDIKDKYMEEEILKLISNNDLEKDVFIVSEYTDAIKRIKDINPKIKIVISAVTKENQNERIQKAIEINAEMIKVHNVLITKEFIKEAHKYDLGVLSWGAESEHEIKAMIDLKVDAIACGFPDRITKLMN